MATQVKIPALGESITQATIVKWHKQDGDRVERDEALCELETDKANVDVPATEAGTLHRIKNEGEAVAIGEVIAEISPLTAAETAKPAPASAPTQPPPAALATPPAKPAPDASPVMEPLPAPEARPGPAAPPPSPPVAEKPLIPSVRRLTTENNLNPADIASTGKGDRLTKQDVLAHLEARSDVTPFPGAAPSPAASSASPVPGARVISAPPASTAGDGTRREPMSRIRRKIAERLVNAQHTAAILTTFNEIDMSAVQELRTRYKDKFTELHGVGLGLMSFFVRACVLALHEFPRVNAFLEGDDVVYHDYVHLGIAVSTQRGLTVPVLRHAQGMGFADVESEIKRLATAARDGKLAIDELSGGTFTITNGGVFGSLLSTPILNPPQSAILGMHTIQKRPVAVSDKVEIHPMMYVALSYDHRMVDGRDSVSFLVRVKQLVEDPARLMLDV